MDITVESVMTKDVDNKTIITGQDCGSRARWKLYWLSTLLTINLIGYQFYWLSTLLTVNFIGYHLYWLSPLLTVN